MTHPLISHISKLLPGISVKAGDILPFTTTHNAPKGEVLLKENETCDAIYFVVKGCLYLYYEQEHTEQVVHFALDNWWITDYKTFATRGAAVYNIAAMEDSELVVITRGAYENLLNQHPVMALYFNKIHERAYGAALLKQKTYATLSKEAFYRYFKSTYPEIIARIPDAIFASYMQVSQEELMQLKTKSVS